MHSERCTSGSEGGHEKPTVETRQGAHGLPYGADLLLACGGTDNGPCRCWRWQTLLRGLAAPLSIYTHLDNVLDSHPPALYLLLQQSISPHGRLAVVSCAWPATPSLLPAT